MLTVEKVLGDLLASIRTEPTDVDLRHHPHHATLAAAFLEADSPGTRAAVHKHVEGCPMCAARGPAHGTRILEIVQTAAAIRLELGIIVQPVAVHRRDLA